jgi:hypothetical protein
LHNYPNVDKKEYNKRVSNLIENMYITKHTFQDNVGIEAVMGPSKSSGEEFLIGVYKQKYIAMDWDGNKASCNFTIEVVAKGED